MQGMGTVPADASSKEMEECVGHGDLFLVDCMCVSVVGIFWLYSCPYPHVCVHVEGK